MRNQELMLFVLNHSRQFGEQVSNVLGVALSEHEEREFEDGEHKARPLGSVRDRDVYVLHSLYGDAQQSGNDKLCRLLFFIGALKDAAAARVTAVVPYLAYARKDRKSKTRDPVTTRYVAALFEAVGTDAIVTMEVHNLAAYQNAFRCPTEHLQANQLFSSYFTPQLVGADVVVISPDAGGIKRAEQFRQSFSRTTGAAVGAGFAEKCRSEGIVSGDMLVGDVERKTVIIIDDLISTGTTLARTASMCMERGASRVMAAATHGLFTGNANAILEACPLEQIVITDTVPPFRLAQGLAQKKIRTVSSARLFADTIWRLHCGGSITELIDA